MDNQTVFIEMIVAFASVHGMEFLKNAKWFKLLQPHWTTVNRIVGAIVALATTVGFTMQVTGDIHSGGQLIIGFPTLHAFLEAFSTWMFQQMYYKSAVNKKG